MYFAPNLEQNTSEPRPAFLGAQRVRKSGTSPGGQTSAEKPQHFHGKCCGFSSESSS
jgi:hypothetical protein